MLPIDTPRGKQLLTEVEKIDPEGKKERTIEETTESKNDINWVAFGVTILILIVTITVLHRLINLFRELF